MRCDVEIIDFRLDRSNWKIERIYDVDLNILGKEGNFEVGVFDEAWTVYWGSRNKRKSLTVKNIDSVFNCMLHVLSVDDSIWKKREKLSKFRNKFQNKVDLKENKIENELREMIFDSALSRGK